MPYIFFYQVGEQTPIEMSYESITEDDFREGSVKIHIYNKETNGTAQVTTAEEWAGWCTASERIAAWKPEEVLSQCTKGEDEQREWIPEDTTPFEVPVKDHINPSHYQGYVMELQWLETMQYLPRYRNPESFIAAVELQGRKYFDRNGGKDEELQELTKGLWYFKFLVAYIKNGRKPIRVKDIDNILAGRRVSKSGTVK
jgi:hypothetical protein